MNQWPVTLLSHCHIQYFRFCDWQAEGGQPIGLWFNSTSEHEPQCHHSPVQQVIFHQTWSFSAGFCFPPENTDVFIFSNVRWKCNIWSFILYFCIFQKITLKWPQICLSFISGLCVTAQVSRPVGKPAKCQQQESHVSAAEQIVNDRETLFTFI